MREADRSTLLPAAADRGPAPSSAVESCPPPSGTELAHLASPRRVSIRSPTATTEPAPATTTTTTTYAAAAATTAPAAPAAPAAAATTTTAASPAATTTSAAATSATTVATTTSAAAAAPAPAATTTSAAATSATSAALAATAAAAAAPVATTATLHRGYGCPRQDAPDAATNPSVPELSVTASSIYPTSHRRTSAATPTTTATTAATAAAAAAAAAATSTYRVTPASVYSTSPRRPSSATPFLSERSGMSASADDGDMLTPGRHLSTPGQRGHSPQQYTTPTQRISSGGGGPIPVGGHAGSPRGRVEVPEGAFQPRLLLKSAGRARPPAGIPRPPSGIVGVASSGAGEPPRRSLPHPPSGTSAAPRPARPMTASLHTGAKALHTGTADVHTGASALHTGASAIGSPRAGRGPSPPVSSARAPPTVSTRPAPAALNAAFFSSAKSHGGTPSGIFQGGIHAIGGPFGIPVRSPRPGILVPSSPSGIPARATLAGDPARKISKGAYDVPEGAHAFGAQGDTEGGDPSRPIPEGAPPALVREMRARADALSGELYCYGYR